MCVSAPNYCQNITYGKGPPNLTPESDSFSLESKSFSLRSGPKFNEFRSFSLRSGPLFSESKSFSLKSGLLFSESRSFSRESCLDSTESDVFSRGSDDVFISRRFAFGRRVRGCCVYRGDGGVSGPAFAGGRRLWSDYRRSCAGLRQRMFVQANRDGRRG
jgi:hypothetical protein